MTVLPAADVVSVVIVGTVVLLRLRILVDALLVKAVIAPVPESLTVPLLVNVAVVIAPVPLMAIVPPLALVIVPTEEVPPIFRVPVAPLANVPVPDNAAVAVMVPLLVSVTVVTVSAVAQVKVAELV